MRIGNSSARRAIAAVLIILVLCAGAATAWHLSRRHRFPMKTATLLPPRSLTSFSENGVTVEIGVQEDTSGRMWFSGTFTPEQAGFHLYSKDLPREGLQGLGRPTLIEIASTGTMRSAGRLEADKPVTMLRFDILHQSFPVYPNGPVILRLPVRLVAGETDAPRELSVTYMACSDAKCLPPVIDKRVVVRK